MFEKCDYMFLWRYGSLKVSFMSASFSRVCFSTLGHFNKINLTSDRSRPRERTRVRSYIDIICIFGQTRTTFHFEFFVSIFFSAFVYAVWYCICITKYRPSA